MKYYIIVGEPSGDLHASKIINGIKTSDPNAEFRFWGGDKMAQAGGIGNLAKHYKESSFMGFWEVFKNLGKILRQIKECKEDVLNYAPDVLILVDYAGFNLRMAKFAKGVGIRTFYYIAPKVWAWKESRVKKIKRYVDELFVIFPFEVEYFAKFGIKAHYMGNPIMDAIVERNLELREPQKFRDDCELDERPIIALLAGSRKNEIAYNLPFMVEVASHFPQYQFAVAGVPWLDKKLYEDNMKGGIGNVKYLCNVTYELLANSYGAIVTSGTATLETALLGVPELVCYWCNPISAAIGRMFLKLRWVSLVNIIMGREVVRELIYKDMVASVAVEELRAILPGGDKHDKLLSDYAELTAAMGKEGASNIVAQKIVELTSRG